MQNLFNQKIPLLFSHRGGAGLFPENTLYAFQKSVDLYKADVLELDIQATGDGELVVIHDESVDRTTNGTGWVGEKSLKEIKKLDAGWHFSLDGGKTFPFRDKGLTIPTLKEVFEFIQSNQVGLNIEVKRIYHNIENKLYNMIISYNLMNRVLVTSSRSSVMNRFYSINKRGIFTGADAIEGGQAFILSKIGLGALYTPKANALQLPLVFKGTIRVISEKLVTLCKGKKVKLHVWTINETEDMKRLLDMGVDGIISDYPDRLYEVFKTYGYKD